MPIYEYECRECKTKESFVRSVTESDPGYNCKACNLQLTRVYSLGAITFNGSGFYSTENRMR
jgi:putative FmdB family regulatory protein